eukprot:364196-Chlamydomonas_euryale.AAC.2
MWSMNLTLGCLKLYIMTRQVWSPTWLYSEVTTGGGGRPEKLGSSWLLHRKCAGCGTTSRYAASERNSGGGPITSSGRAGAAPVAAWRCWSRSYRSCNRRYSPPWWSACMCVTKIADRPSSRRSASSGPYLREKVWVPG